MDGRSGQGSSQTLIRTIDAHAAGGPLRLVVDGFPSPRGNTMGKKRAWAEQHADGLRRTLILEPRGHADMCGAVLTEPTWSGADAGILFFHNGGFAAMSGHGILAAAKIAIERGLIMPRGSGSTITFETDAGTVRIAIRADQALVADLATARGGGEGQGDQERTHEPAHPSGRFDPRQARAVAAGGQSGVSRRGPELRRTGLAIKEAAGKVMTLDGTVFTGPPHESGADLRNATVFADGALDRSPSGTATSAVMAVLNAMGLLGEDRPFVHEGITGTQLRGRVIGRTTAGELPAIVTEIEGEVWITGEHTFLVDDRDPLKSGFVI